MCSLLYKATQACSCDDELTSHATYKYMYLLVVQYDGGHAPKNQIRCRQTLLILVAASGTFELHCSIAMSFDEGKVVSATAATPIRPNKITFFWRHRHTELSVTLHV